MPGTDFSNFSLEEIKNWAIHHKDDELKSHISKMSSEQLGTVISKIGEKSDPDWKSKTCAIITGLTDIQQLEVAAKYLNLSQILEILENSQNWDSGLKQSKLPSLFVGMPHQLFSEMLGNTSQQHLDVLKYESITEPLQHHLMLFIHQATNKINEFSDSLAILEKEIQQVDLEEITHQEINKIRTKIEEIRHQFLFLLEKINRCLAIAWNTNRPDLVDKVSSLKEYCQRAYLFIGVPGSVLVKTSGLYEILDQRLNNIFGNPNNPQDIEALSDDEPIIEALTKFSVWYIQHYWEIGLLPSIHTQNELDLDPKNHSEKERLTYREKLFSEVEANLHRLGLMTLKDLKVREIYSKRGLINFIQENKQKMSHSVIV